MKTSLANMDDALDSEPAFTTKIACSRCGAAHLAPDEIKTAFWHGDSLIVVEGIPGLVCMACGEEFVSDETAARLDQIKARREPVAVTRHMSVPVFDFATLPRRER